MNILAFLEKAPGGHLYCRANYTMLFAYWYHHLY